MPLLSTHIFKKICSFLRFLIYLHRCVEIWNFLSFLRVKSPLRRCGKYPLSLLTTFAASSPKGAPFGAAAKFPAKVRSLRVRQRLPPRGSWQSRKALTEGVKHPLSHTKSTASLYGKRCFFQPFSARLWKTRCSSQFFLLVGTMTFNPPMYGCSTSGMVTLPSACRWFSRKAISIRGGATQVLFRVWAR